MKKLCTLSAVMFLFFIGCVSFSKPSTVCQMDQPSLICEKIPNPENADILLQLANVEAIKSDIYSAQQAYDFLTECEQYLNGASTYKDVCTYLISEIDDIGIEIIILSQYVNDLNVDLLMYDYDRELLKIHIEHQKKILLLYMGATK